MQTRHHSKQWFRNIAKLSHIFHIEFHYCPTFSSSDWTRMFYKDILWRRIDLHSVWCWAISQEKLVSFQRHSLTFMALSYGRTFNQIFVCVSPVFWRRLAQPGTTVTLEPNITPGRVTAFRITRNTCFSSRRIHYRELSQVKSYFLKSLF